MEVEARKDNKQPDERVVQEAVNEAGFGKFNVKVAIISHLTFLNVAFSVTSIAFILPAAACDFQMTTVDKGRLSAAPMLGMLCGSYGWGCFAATKGRRKCLLVALFLHGISELLASVVPFYWVFVSLKFLSGAAMNGQFTVFLYLSEFQPTKYRDRVMSWMELAWVSGMIILSGVGWLVVPLDIRIEWTYLTFHSWNFFVMICSLPALAIGTWLICFPETPKYLAESGQSGKMLDVLMRMYSENTGEPPKEYITKLKNCQDHQLAEMVKRIIDSEDDVKKKSFTLMLKDILVQTKAILMAPYLTRTILLCLISCFVTAAYYMLTLWLPELFHRYADFEEAHPNRSATVCTLSLEKSNKSLVDLEDPFGCNSTVQPSVFVHTFILGASCIPTGLLLPVLVNFIGYKYVLVLTTLIPAVVTLCLFLVKTSTQNLILSCIFESVTSVSVSIVYCLLVDLYPTHLRAMSAGLSALLSRAGALGGNLLMGYLIDQHCTMVIIIVSAQLFVCVILALFTPGKEDSGKPSNPEANGAKVT